MLALARKIVAGEPGEESVEDVNGLPEGADRTDFYEHDANWSNRMILADSPASPRG